MVYTDVSLCNHGNSPLTGHLTSLGRLYIEFHF